MTFSLRLFACFYSIHQDAPILHPLLFRDGIQEQKTSICSKAANGGLVIAGRKRKLQGHWLPTKEVPSTGLPSRVDTVPPQPIQCSRTIQHILWRGGDERHRNIHQGGQIRAELLPAQVANTAHAAGNGHRNIQPAANCHGAAGGQSTAGTGLQGLLQVITINTDEFFGPFPERQVLPDGAKLQLAPIYPS